MYVLSIKKSSRIVWNMQRELSQTNSRADGPAVKIFL
jgi:hypothetical protein